MKPSVYHPVISTAARVLASLLSCRLRCYRFVLFRGATRVVKVWVEVVVGVLFGMGCFMDGSVDVVSLVWKVAMDGYCGW